MAVTRAWLVGLALLGGCGRVPRDVSDVFGVWVVEDEAGAPVAARLLQVGVGGSDSAFEEYVYDDLGARFVAGGAYGLRRGRDRVEGVRHVATLRFVYGPYVADGGVGFAEDVFGGGRDGHSEERILHFDDDRLETLTAWTDEVVVQHRYASLP